METQLGISISGKPFGIDALSWSEDGIIATCTETSIQLITPIVAGLSSDDGNFKVNAIVNDLLPESADYGESKVIDKPMEPSYAIPEVYRSICWSPTGLSRTYGCLLTVVTTKHRVLLFELCRNTSNWSLHTDMTCLLKRNVLQNSDDTDTFQTLDQIKLFHSLYVAWSPIIITEPLIPNPALMAISNQAGGISLWSYSVVNGLEHQTSFKPHSSFVNLVTWSKWRKHNDCHVGYILSTSTTGTAVLTCVKVRCDSSTIKSIETDTIYTWFEENSGLASIIKLWDESGDSIKILISKFVNVYLAVLNVTEDKVVMDGDWMDYNIPRTAFGASGAYFANGGQYMRLFTYEGDGLVLSCENGTLELADRLSIGMTRKLHSKFKQQWAEDISKNEEEDLLNNLDMIPQVWGVDDTPNGLYSAIMYTIKPVVDIHTYGESRDSTSIAFLIHPKIKGDNAIQRLLKNMISYVEDPDFFFTYPVHAILHEQLEFILDEEENESLMTCLRQLNDLMEKPNDANSRWTHSNLPRRVFSPTNAIASRIAFYFNNEMKNYKLQDDSQKLLNELEMKSCSYIVYSFFQSVLSYCNERDDKFWNSLGVDDILQVLLWCDRILYEVLPLPPSDLLRTVKTTYEKLQSHCSSSPLLENLSIEMDLVDSALNGNSVMNVDIRPKQKCPACGNWIPFSLGAICVCSAGHPFDRCAITLKVIASPFYQCCTKCGSKRLQLSTNGSHQHTSTSSMSLSDTVLSECWKCIYCGSGMETITI